MGFFTIFVDLFYAITTLTQFQDFWTLISSWFNTGAAA